MAVSTPICDFGWRAPDFRLPSTDGRIVALDEVRGTNGTLVLFICNHCPYVTSTIARIVADAKALQAEGIGVVAICSNDATTHPADGFEPMKAFAATHGFSFPYLHDEAQEVARAYDAVCTPDFFGFDRDLGLQYRGRLDAGRPKDPLAPGARRELLDAMRAVARGAGGPAEQIPSMGCSIKWRRAA